jgi:hypothetical protein
MNARGMGSGGDKPVGKNADWDQAVEERRASGAI